MRNRSENSAHSFTKEILFMALCKLIEQKSFDQISIKELSQEAGISRTTFYRNYHDIEDILLDYYREHPFGALSLDSYRPENFNLRNCLHDSFEDLKEHNALWKNLLDSGKDYIFFRVYDETIKTTCKNRAFDLGFRSAYELSALVGIYYSICRDWIIGGMQESVNEMTDISYGLIHTFYKSDK